MMLDPGRCIVRNTASRKGRTRTVEPGVTASRHLYYGRIVLDGNQSLDFGTEGLETGLVCLKGSASIGVHVGEVLSDLPVRGSDRPEYVLRPYDTLYVPRDASVEIEAGEGGCDLAEIAAPVTRHHPVQFVSFAKVQQDPGLHFEAGGPAARRVLNVLIGKNVEAGRIMAGVTFSDPGNWTSWPPHEHAAMLEEAYLYVEMPPPSFGVQLVYTNPQEPELATIVRQDDVILMPAGYHPNVAAPGGAINFVWMMAANREDDDRQFGVVNVQPDFRTSASGLDPGRAEKR